MHRSVTLITAPSNLGLRPLRSEHVPGTWRAPEALIRAGLEEIVRPHSTIDLPRPAYNALPQLNTRLLNGLAIRDFNLALAGVVSEVFASQRFALVLGGDCSILLGALAGLRRHGPISLVHIDGHSDFRHPGNYDADKVLGTVAGMDLALATGRGEVLLTHWPNIVHPLVPDVQVVQIGERESRNSDFQWPDVNDTEINRIDVFAARELGAEGVLRRTYSTLDRVDWPFWIHLDVDVLDQELDFLNFLGIEDIAFTYAEGLAMGEEAAQEALKAAHEHILDLVASLSAPQPSLEDNALSPRHASAVSA